MVRGWDSDVTVLGGCGHVGLPVGLALAASGLRTVLYDTNLAAVDRVRSGKMPHREAGADEVLARSLDDGTLVASGDPSVIAGAEHLVVVIGTPVDEYLNPDPQAVVTALEEIADQLVDGQLLILRSTVFPGVTRMVERLITDSTAMQTRLAKKLGTPEHQAQVEGLEQLHHLELAVLELRHVPRKVLDLFVHGLQVACRGHLPAVEPPLYLGAPRPRR